ncbi:hypothetical protein [Kitasatospora sp. NPDC093806]|uniref:hypothetical protein n=1 Tax=Kitasatospora sp. NPDC093806 TaxID=3155075 RepID=UPI00342ABA2F
MPRHTHGDAIPPHLRAAAIRCALEVVGDLQDVLQYSAPALADHGWARMCMYRASDAMDAIGRFVGVFAAHLVRGGESRAAIRGLLRADRECLRTARPGCLGGRRYLEHDLHRMPEWLTDRVYSSLAFVMLRLPVVLRRSLRSRDTLWSSRCLLPMVDSMDELGRLIGLFAAVHGDVLDESTLARYQHLFQQRPRVNMPTDDDHDYLNGLLGLPGRAEALVWYHVGRRTADWPEGPLGPDSYEEKVFTLLAMLEEQFDGHRWEGPDGTPLPRVRSAAAACLNGLELAKGEDADDPVYWLTGDERIYAEVVATLLRERLAGGRPDSAERDRRSMLEVLHTALNGAPVGSQR